MAVYRSVELRDLLTRQALALERHRTVVARQLGLSDTELVAIVHLVQDGELTPGELRERLALSSGGTTALIQRLLRQGHVERRPHPRDGRSVIVRVGEGMREQLAMRVAPLVAAIDEAAERLTGAERAVVGAWLDRIVAAIEAEARAAGELSDGIAPTNVSNAWF
jgi:DNA-binding MarR family transcriptional regulator